MAIHNYLDLSTAHIMQSDSEILTENKNLPFRVIDHDYGFFINVQDHIKPVNLMMSNLSIDFSNMYKHAIENNCNWINLDCDADVIDNLNINDW